MNIARRFSSRISRGVMTWAAKAVASAVGPVVGGGGWRRLIRESYPGAWQQNVVLSQRDLLSFVPVFACITRIASDIAKLPWQIRDKRSDGSWQEIGSSNYSAYTVLKRPNQYQNAIQFREAWVTSKLWKGNALMLKGRDDRGVVKSMWVVDWDRVTPVVTERGDVYYKISTDNINGIREESVTVPSSEVIHDRMNCLFHPLVGVSPLYAAALVAASGLNAQQDSVRFFANGARPSGIITIDGPIGNDVADRMKAYWDENFTGENAGRVAVLGDGAKFESMKMSAAEAQLSQQLEMAATWVCAAFHVPPYKVGFAAAPSQTVEADNLRYYTDCLQGLIEAMELSLGEGLGMDPWAREIYLDIDNLMRMDMKTLYETLGAGVKNIVLSPNEARARLNLSPVPGGESPLSQQQNYSLEALAKRDALPYPFASGASAPTPAPAPAAAAPDAEPLDDESRSVPGYREAYEEGAQYIKGDTVTYDGTLWHCRVDNPTGRPKQSDDWRLMVKTGERRRGRQS